MSKIKNKKMDTKKCEIWKSIAGYESMYEISNMGRLRNSKTGTIIRPYMRGGYENYVLWYGCEEKSFLAHRLVVLAFIKEDLAANEVVHHIDDNPFNNTVGNLKVMTRGEHSALHRHRKGLKMVRLRCPNCHKEFTREYSKTHLETSRKTKGTFCCHECAGKFCTNKSIKDKMRIIDESVIEIFRRYLDK